VTKPLSERLKFMISDFENIGVNEQTVCMKALREAAELARRVEDSQWIACADRLPDPSDHVQVFPDTHEPQTYNFYAHFNGGTNGVKAGNWYHNDETGYDHIITPTHWRRISRDEPSVRLVVEVGA